MAEVNLPFNIKNGDGLDADQVMANDQILAQSINGGLEAGSNVTTAAAVTQVGNANAEGTAATVARSDHTHIIQGVENLTADPTTGNFEGRVFWNTTANVFRYYDGATWFDLTPSAASLIVHAAQHKDGGHDPLPDNTITDHMRAARTNVVTASQSADVNGLSTGGFTDLTGLTAVAFTTNGIQTLRFDLAFVLQATANAPNGAVRVIDVTAANTTIWMSPVVQINNGQQTGVWGSFTYTVPVAGARTFKFQAGAGATANALAPVTFHTETVKGPSVTITVA